MGVLGGRGFGGCLVLDFCSQSFLSTAQGCVSNPAMQRAVHRVTFNINIDIAELERTNADAASEDVEIVILTKNKNIVSRNVSSSQPDMTS